MNAYYTHRQYLQEELNRIDKSKKEIIILELGTGDGSALILNEFCKNNSNVRVYSFESDNSWRKKIEEKYKLSNYIFYSIINEDWKNIDKIIKDIGINEIDLAFVDQGTWEGRIESIDALKDLVNVIILHDYDYYTKIHPPFSYQIKEGTWLYDKYHKDYKLTGHHSILPPTLIMKKL